MGGSTPRSTLMRVRDMERVKCRTGGRSPAGRSPRRGGTQPGPGEERHFTRAMSQYAPGCWWGCFLPPPAAPRRAMLLTF